MNGKVMTVTRELQTPPPRRFQAMTAGKRPSRYHTDGMLWTLLPASEPIIFTSRKTGPLIHVGAHKYNVRSQTSWMGLPSQLLCGSTLFPRPSTLKLVSLPLASEASLGLALSPHPEKCRIPCISPHPCFVLRLRLQMRHGNTIVSRKYTPPPPFLQP